MKHLLILALLLLLSSPVHAATILIDGDTIDVDGERIRIFQIDTPETFRPRCEAELVLGLKAKARMRELLDSARPLTIVREGYDRWGRTLAYVLAGETDAWLRFLTLTQRPNRPARVFWDQTLQAHQAGVAK